MKRLTVDASIIVSSLLENEPRHKEALRIWDTVLAGKNVAILPYSEFVEVVAAVRRRTGSEEWRVRSASNYWKWRPFFS